MAEEKKFNTVTDGTFSLKETSERGIFLFYRNDREVLGEIGREPLDLYRAYITKKMMDGEIKEVVASNVKASATDDGKCLIVSITDIDLANGKPNFLKHVFQKMFG